MRKLILALCGLIIIFPALADLGEIQVNSYLNQPFNALIPISGVKDSDYSTLNIGLASGAKFKEYGIDFNPELGVLQFRIIKKSQRHYLLISSNKAISSPVLSLLLHYKEGNDDFYRQVTALLDPPNYPQIQDIQNKVVVVKDNPSAKKLANVERAIPIYAKPEPVSIQDNVTESVNFTPDYSSPFVQAHLASFDSNAMSYTTMKGDNLYDVSHFIQLLYPELKLNANQVLVALGLENYRDLHGLSYTYESGMEIFLPKPQEVLLIPTDLADQYLLDNKISANQKQNLLINLAAKFDTNLLINDPDLFIPEPKIIIKPSVVHESNNKRSLSYWLDEMNHFKRYWLSLILGLIIVILWRKFKPLALMAKLRQLNLKVEENSKVDFNYDGFTMEALNHNDVTTTNPTEAKAKPMSRLDVPNMDLEFPLNTNELVAKNLVDEELILTLEHILAVDDTRDDIRNKLFELYLASAAIEKASIIYAQLKDNLDAESPLHRSLADIGAQYDFHYVDNNEKKEVKSSAPKLELVLEEPRIKYVAAKTTDLKEQSVPSSTTTKEAEVKPAPIIEQQKSQKIITNEKLEDNSLDFVSIKPEPLNLKPAQVENSVQIDNERGLDYPKSVDEQVVVPVNIIETVTNLEDHANTLARQVDSLDSSLVIDEQDDLSDELTNSETVARNKQSDKYVQIANEVSYLDDEANLELGLYDEQMNLARMYCQIEELAKAREILNQLLNTTANEMVKQQIRQLMMDLGLND